MRVRQKAVRASQHGQPSFLVIVFVSFGFFNSGRLHKKFLIMPDFLYSSQKKYQNKPDCAVLLVVEISL